MDAYVAVYELGDVEVDGDAGKHVGVVAGHVLFGDEEVDHVAEGVFGGLFQVGAEAHADVVGGCFSARPEQRLLFVDDEAKGTGEEGFHGGDVDFAVALTGVAVARDEEGTGGGDRDVKSGAGDELFVVHVAGVGEGWCAVNAARSGGDAHAAEKGMQRDVDARSEVTDHFVAVERDDAVAAVGELHRKEAAVEAEAVAREVGIDGDFEDLDFEEVAGFGFGDGDGAGENVAAGAFVFVGVILVDGIVVGGNIGGFYALFDHAVVRAAGGEGLDGDGVAGMYGEGGLDAGGVVAPLDGGGCGEEGVVAGEKGRGCGEEQAGEQRERTHEETPVRSGCEGA